MGEKGIRPARLNSNEVAVYLGFGVHDIPVLIASRMLKPLGKPVPNATKYFAACKIEELANNQKWLGEATQTVYDYWKGKNSRKTANSSPLTAVH